MKKYIIICITIMVIVFSGIDLKADSSLDNDEILNKKIEEIIEKSSTDYGYEYLRTLKNGENMRKFYKVIEEESKNFLLNYTDDLVEKGKYGDYVLIKFKLFDYGINYQEAITVLRFACYDMPIYYFLHEICVLGQELYISVNDQFIKGEKRREFNKMICNGVDKYASKVGGVKSEYSIAKLLYEELAKDLNYDRINESNEYRHRINRTIIGAFLDGDVICAGYARTFQLLLKYLGLDTIIVSGTNIDGVGHEWNLVKMNNGQWYWFDLTWDDTDGKNGVIEDCRYNFFCKTDEDFLQTHIVNTSENSIIPQKVCLYDLPKRGESLKNIECMHPKVEKNGLDEICTTCERIFEHKHVIVIDEEVPATCMSIGLTEGSHCELCEKIFVFQKTIPTLPNHSIVIDEEVPATCKSPGLTEGMHCEICYKVIVKQEEIPLEEHIVTIDKGEDATCKKAGLTDGLHCENCGEIIVKQEIIPVKEHTLIIDEAKEPTCQKTGLTEGAHCENCGEIIINQEEIPKKEHVLGEWIIEWEATYDYEGLKSRKCEVCKSIVEEEVIPKLVRDVEDNVIEPKDEGCNSASIINMVFLLVPIMFIRRKKYLI